MFGRMNVAFVRQPKHAGELVRKRHDHDIAVHNRRKQAPKPSPERGIALAECRHGRSRAMYKQSSEVDVSTLCDAQQTWLAAGRKLSWYKC